jgi:hypothetical protein
MLRKQEPIVVCFRGTHWVVVNGSQEQEFLSENAALDVAEPMAKNDKNSLIVQRADGTIRYTEDFSQSLFPRPLALVIKDILIEPRIN